MRNPSILVYHRQSADLYKSLLQKHGIENIVTASTPEEALSSLPGCDILFGWRVPPEILSFAPRLRWIQTMGAGVDDLVERSDIAPEVMITRIVDQFGSPIAEYVFSRLLYVIKNLPRSLEAQQQGVWSPFVEETLTGKTIGIAGLGSIGCQIAKLAKAFNMQVCGLSRTSPSCSQVDRHFLPHEWTQFIAQVDVLVLALPLTSDTFHILNQEHLSRMKKGSWLVNVGRGSLVSESDLLVALQQGPLRGAILDVFEQEPLPADHKFWTLPNVYVTPHISGPSQVDLVVNLFLSNLRRYENGEVLLGIVDRERGY